MWTQLDEHEARIAAHGEALATVEEWFLGAGKVLSDAGKAALDEARPLLTEMIKQAIEAGIQVAIDRLKGGK